MNNIYCLIFRVPRPLWVPHVEGNIQSVACELCRKRIDVVSVENSPHHSSIVSISERSIVEVLFKLQTKLQITKRMNVILHLNWVRATSKSILHQPFRGAIDGNDRKFFNIEFFERRFSTGVILNLNYYLPSLSSHVKGKLYLVNSKL